MQKDVYPIMLFDFVHCMPAMAPSLCNKLFRRQLLERIIIQVNDTIAYGEDALCTYACLLNAECIYISEAKLYHYRNHTESVSNGYSLALLEKFLLLIQHKSGKINMVYFEIKITYFRGLHTVYEG